MIFGYEKKIGLNPKQGDFNAHLTVCKAPRGKNQEIPEKVFEKIRGHKKWGREESLRNREGKERKKGKKGKKE